MKEPAQSPPKSRPRHIALKFAIAFGGLALLLVYVSQCGVRVTLPQGSPFERFDAEAAGIFPNAALIYEEAISTKVAIEAGMRDWPNALGRDGQPIPLEIAAWIDDQEPLIRLLGEAAACEGCYFRLTSIEEGYLVPYLSPLRSCANLVAIRARLAAERHDLPRFRESLRTLNRLADHVHQQPLIIAHVVGCAVRAGALELAPLPLTWPELSSADRLAYVAEVRSACDEKPMTAAMFRREAEMSCYSAFQFMDWRMQLLVPRSRIWGELLRLNEPVEQLLAQSIERQADVNNPLRAQISAGLPPRTIPRAIANPARALAEQCYFSPEGTVELQAKVITLQRGMRLLLSIVEHAEKTGRLPESLNELGPANMLEPYTNAPFVYRRVGADFRLYAAWQDRDDDGGRAIENRRNPTTQWLGAVRVPDGDRIFWPVEAECAEPQ